MCSTAVSVRMPRCRARIAPAAPVSGAAPPAGAGSSTSPRKPVLLKDRVATHRGTKFTIRSRLFTAAKTQRHLDAFDPFCSEANAFENEKLRGLKLAATSGCADLDFAEGLRGVLRDEEPRVVVVHRPARRVVQRVPLHPERGVAALHRPRQVERVVSLRTSSASGGHD